MLVQQVLPVHKAPLVPLGRRDHKASKAIQVTQGLKVLLVLPGLQDRKVQRAILETRALRVRLELLVFKVHRV